MYNCAEGQTRVCKAYISDCYSHIAKAVNNCNSAERLILKSNVFAMLDRIKVLLDGESPSEESNSVEETG